MPVNKALVTYDISEQTHEEVRRWLERRKDPFMCFDSATYNLGKLSAHQSRDQIDRRILRGLRDSGVSVEILSFDEVVEMGYSGLHEKLVEADLIFHDTWRLGSVLMMDDWMDRYESEDNQREWGLIDKWLPAVGQGDLDYVDRLLQDWDLDELVREGVNSMIEPHYHKTRLLRSGTHPWKKELPDIAGEEGIPVPITMSVDEYMASGGWAPVVLKLAGGGGGKDTFLIEHPEQLHRFFDKDCYFATEAGKREGVPRPKNYLVQEVIPCPSDHFTHYRILTLGDGTIVGGVLTVSENTKGERKPHTVHGRYTGRQLPNILTDQRTQWNEPNPAYIALTQITSNKGTGGKQIALDANGQSKPPSPDYRQVLLDHGLDATQPQIPAALRKLAVTTAQALQKQGLMVTAQDWIADANQPTQGFYLMEAETMFGPEIFNTLFMEGTANPVRTFSRGYRMLGHRMAEMGATDSIVHPSS